MNIDRIKQAIHKAFPWGPLFAKRNNFKGGYFIEEGRLVSRYLRQPSDVLIIGSGNGREARPICQGDYRIVGMDTGLVYLQSGKRLFASEGIKNVHFVQADMAHLPFSKDSFDFVFHSLYSHSGEQRFDIIRNIHWILRPHGLVLLSTETPWYVEREPGRDFGSLVVISSAEQLRKEVSSCAFEMLESAVDPKRPEYRFAMLRKKPEAS